MKKFFIALLLVLFCSTAYADTKFQKGFASRAYTSSAQVFNKDVILYGWDVVTDGTNATTFELYDTSSYRTATGAIIGNRYTITSSSTDRVQARDYAIPIQTTADGVYLKFVFAHGTTSSGNKIVLYYDYSKYREYDP